MATRILLEGVPDDLEYVELLLGGHIAFGQPTDRGVKYPAGGLDGALLFQFVKGLEHVGRGFADVRVVELQEAGVFHVEAFKALFGHLTGLLTGDFLEEFVMVGLQVIVEVIADFGGDGDLVAVVDERPTDDLLGVAAAIYVVRVEETDVLLGDVVGHLGGVFVWAVAPPVGLDDPHTEADLADFGSGGVELAVVHGRLYELR